jgi:hypothetical protein
MYASDVQAPTLTGPFPKHRGLTPTAGGSGRAGGQGRNHVESGIANY